MDNKQPNGKKVMGQATALYSYEACAPDKLNINTGDILDIHSAVPDNGWFSAYNRRSRQSGLVHSTYIDVLSDHDKPNFHNTVTDIGDGESFQSGVGNTMTQEDLQTSADLGTVIEDHIICDGNELFVNSGDIVEILKQPIDGLVWVKDIATHEEGYIPIGKLKRKEELKKNLLSDVLRDALNIQQVHKRISSEPVSQADFSNKVDNGENSFSVEDQGIVVKAVYDYNNIKSSPYVQKGEEVKVHEDEDSGEESDASYITINKMASKNKNQRSTHSQQHEETFSNQTLKRMARLKCTKGIVKEGENVEVIDTTNPKYLLVRHRESSNNFYVKPEELHFTKSEKSTKDPPVPTSTPSSSNHSQISSSLSNTSQLLPTSSIPQDASPNKAFDGLARLKINRGPMVEGEEVEVLDKSNSHYTLVRHRGSDNEFYLNNEVLEFPSATSATSPLIPTNTDSAHNKRQKSTFYVESNELDATSDRQIPSPPTRNYRPTMTSPANVSPTLTKLQISQGTKPKVPPKLGLVNVQFPQMKIPPPLPPQRKVIAQQIVNEEDIANKEYYMEIIDRSTVKSLLFSPGNEEGAFLVRKTGTVDNEYALSIRYRETVKNYRISCDNDGLYYVNDGETFPSVVSLVTHYHNNGGAGLAHKMIAPYSKVPSNPTTTFRKTSLLNCPICFESLDTVQSKGGQMYSTGCGHIFCFHCLDKTLKCNQECPTCRKEQSMKNCHPLYF